MKKIVLQVGYLQRSFVTINLQTVREHNTCDYLHILSIFLQNFMYITCCLLFVIIKSESR